MGLVRAKKDVYLNEHGYHAKGSEFEYNGPDNDNLESVEAGPYNDYGDEELRTEIRRRGLTYVAVATKKDLEAVLAEDDSKAGKARVEPKPPKPRQGPRGDAKATEAGTGSSAEEQTGDGTSMGRDLNGKPTEKGSAEDVS